MRHDRSKTRIGVCGIGQMGAAAAVCFSRAGFPVLLWARDERKLATVPAELDRLARFLDVEVGPASAAPGMIERTGELDRVARGATLVLECIAEDIDQKAAFFRRLAPMVERGGILTSCTSGLSITEMGRRSGTGRRLVGAHFWNPPHLMPLVEVVPGEETESGLAEEVADVLRQAGKITVICRDVPGFIGNRLLHALFREAAALVEDGVCTAAEVDLVARLTFALRLPALGPCENMDLVGLDLVAAIQSYLLNDLSTSNGPMRVIEELRSAGRKGMTSGAGFHSWGDGDAELVMEQRDRQVVQQLRFLREIGRIPRPAPGD